MNQSVDYFYTRGIRDARKKAYPLFSVLKAAEEFEKADAYRRGWGEVTGADLEKWRDGERR